MKILLAILEPRVEYCPQTFLRFLLNNVLQKRGQFTLLISLLLAASGCGVNRA